MTVKNNRSTATNAKKMEVSSFGFNDKSLGYALLARVSKSSAHFLVYLPISDATALALLHKAKIAQITISINNIAGIAG